MAKMVYIALEPSLSKVVEGAKGKIMNLAIQVLLLHIYW